MPLLRTKNDDSVITLSVDIKYGLYGTTTIRIAGINLPAVGGSFVNRPIGTNSYLKNKTVLITTTVVLTNDATTTEVIFEFNGARDDDKLSSQVVAGSNDVSVTHLVDYEFI